MRKTASEILRNLEIRTARLEKKASMRPLIESVEFVDSMGNDELSNIVESKLNNAFDGVYFQVTKAQREGSEIKVLGNFQMEVAGVRLYHVDKVFEEVAKKTSWNTRAKYSGDPRGDSTTILQIQTNDSGYILEVYPQNGNYIMSLYAEGEQNPLSKKQMDSILNDKGESFSSGVKRIFRKDADEELLIEVVEDIEQDIKELTKVLKPMGVFLMSGFKASSHWGVSRRARLERVASFKELEKQYLKLIPIGGTYWDLEELLKNKRIIRNKNEISSVVKKGDEVYFSVKSKNYIIKKTVFGGIEIERR